MLNQYQYHSGIDAKHQGWLAQFGTDNKTGYANNHLSTDLAKNTEKTEDWNWLRETNV